MADPSSILMIGPFAGATAALIATYFAWRSARANRKMAEANLIRQVIYEYSSLEMHAALRQIRDWMHDPENAEIISLIRRHNGHKLRHVSSLQEIFSFLRTAPVNLRDIDNSRRTVHFYFLNSFKLLKSGYLDSEAFSVTVDVAGAQLFADVTTPLTVLAHPEFKNKSGEPNFGKIVEDNIISFNCIEAIEKAKQNSILRKIS